jgi:hydrogenase-4 component E
MDTLLDRLMLLLILSDLTLLALRRFSAALRVLSLQGILLGVLALAAHQFDLTGRVALLAFMGLGLRGALFPWLLQRTTRRAQIVEEHNPFVGFAPSLLVGIGLLAAAMILGARLPIRAEPMLGLVVPASLFTVFTGVFLVVARRKALSQCMGYLVLDNGIYGFGVATVGNIPALVELGTLLDALVAVLVMAIAMYRLREEFDHMDTDQLDTLRG